MSFREEFPDFEPKNMPPIPTGWEDVSWRCDACPCFLAPNDVLVFVDYSNPEQREFPDHPRFSVQDNSGDAVLVTDDWSEILTLLTHASA